MYCSEFCAEPQGTFYPERSCAFPGCDARFAPQHKNQMCCSEKHGKLLWNLRHPEMGREKARRRRARKRAAFVAPVVEAELLERDDWICQLCGGRLDLEARCPSPLAAVIDHVLPLFLGGTHEPGNCQAAHFLCNSIKGRRQIPNFSLARIGS